ncbi:hypothetical protein [Leptospira levettii]|uniref:hypothetical protein n=1 Tax=Leptospira levettii TaxID=2023178 RepID=UPI000C29925F|nr:hypothetical protein [Leptospira levettii]PJZ89554.1 hypothetical protein CH368_06240 [Leptospira levettii]
MGVRRVEFLGKNFRKPGSRAAFSPKPQPRSVSDELSVLILIGSADNGFDANNSALPTNQRVMDFSSFPEAEAVLGAGNLLEACYVAFNPSTDPRFRSGPQMVKVLNVSQNTHAQTTVPSVLVGVDKTVRAIVPGPKGNAYRVRVSQNGTVIEVGDADSIQTSTTLQGDELSISYTGNGSSAILSFDGTTLVVTLTGQSDTSQNLSLPIREYKTVGQLVDAINTRVGYTASIIGQADTQSRRLDHILATENVNIKTAPRTMQSLLFRQETFLLGNGLVEISDTNARKPLADMLVFAYLSNGGTTNPSTNDYFDALEFVENEKIPGFYIGVCTTDEAVHVRLADMLDRVNSLDGRLEKVGACGLDRTESTTTRASKIATLSSEFLTVGFSPITNRSANGIDILDFDGWYLGIIALSIKAASNVRETPTYKDLTILGVPERNLKPSELDLVLSKGGLVVERKPQSGPYTIVRALTAFQGTNLILNELSLVSTALALVKDFRESMEGFIGEVPTDPRAIGSTLTDEDIRTYVDELFENKYVRRFGWLTSNPFTGEEAFDKNYTIQRDGDVLFFRFPNGTLVSPINFIFSLLNLDVVRGSSAG